MKLLKLNSSKNNDPKVSEALLAICRKYVVFTGMDPDKMHEDQWNNMLFLAMYAWNLSYILKDKHKALLEKFSEAYKGVVEEEVIQAGVIAVETMVEIKKNNFPNIFKTIDRYELVENKNKFKLRVYSRDIIQN